MPYARLAKVLLWVFSFITIIVVSETGISCSRILRVDDHQAVMVGRTMDWSEDMHTNFLVYPKGILRKGSDDTHPLQWNSRYGSIVATAYSDITTDGLNERGLAAHLLELSESDYGKRNTALPGLSVINWAQFYLDNFQTVDEAIQYTNSHSIQISDVFLKETNEWVKLHLALEDAKGDSAIIEYIHGKAIIYHDRHNIVLTNSPAYHLQLENLREYRGLGGDKPLPGTNHSKDRFVRAAYYTHYLPPATSLQSELFDVLAVIRNVSQLEQLPEDEQDDIAWTQWRIVSDLTHRIYYFDDTAKTSLLWSKLDYFNLDQGAPIMKLDLVNHPEYAGDVSRYFQAI